MTVTLSNGETQKVLEGLTGYVEAATFTALMGPSSLGNLLCLMRYLVVWPLMPSF